MTPTPSPSPATGRKRIYTFYSFKGGVGRSMAVANVAALLSAWAQRVLVVDWDLEAPGLARYFEPFVHEDPPTAGTPGVVDLAEAVAAGQQLDWRDCLVTAHPFKDGPPVKLINAGRDDGRFLARLQALSWDQLFVDHDFGTYLERLRREWLGEFDYVLVDSRTGFSDTGGICTIYLPDVLVVLFTANIQSVRGVAEVVRRAREARSALPFDRGSLLAIPVPGRDESRTEYEQALEWRRVYAAELGDLYRDFLPSGVDPADALDLLRIPHVSYWSFGERLPVVSEGTRDPSSISSAFAVLARLIASGLEWAEAGEADNLGAGVTEGSKESIGQVVAGRDVHITTPGPTAALSQLPAAVRDFTGREAELAQLHSAVASIEGEGVEILAITGPPGAGKTTLAVTFAHQVAPEFPDGQLYVNLGARGDGGMTPAAALMGLLQSLGVPARELPSAVDQLARFYRSRLADRRALILLDDATSEAQVRPLLPGSSTCLVLITSRRLLTGLEGASHVILDVLHPDDAVKLLAKLAGPERVEAEGDAALWIAQLCGYLPLAIRIAGARLAARRHWRLQQLGDRLADERRRLQELQISDLEVRSTFQLGYQGLEEPERQAFRLLGLMPPSHGFSSDAAAALLGLHQLEAEDILERLVEAQFVEADAPGIGQVRYRLHDLLAVFARETSQSDDPADVRNAARRRLVDWYLAGAGAASDTLEAVRRPGHTRDPSFTDVGNALEWFDAERSAVVATVRIADEHGWWPQVWQLAAAMLHYFHLRGHWEDWEATDKLGLSAARRAGDRAGEALMLHQLAVMHRKRRRPEAALRLERQSLSIVDELGDRHGRAQVLRGVGAVYRDLVWYDKAMDPFRESLALFRSSADLAGEARTLRSIGTVLRELGDFAQAEAHYRNSLTMLDQLDDRYGVALCRASLGIVLTDRSRPAEATASYEQALEVFQEVGDRPRTAVTLTNLGTIDASSGRLRDAIQRYQSARQLFRELTDPHGEAVVLRLLGRAEAAMGHRSAAIRYWQQALEFLASGDEGQVRELQALIDHLDSPTTQRWHPIPR